MAVNRIEEALVSLITSASSFQPYISSISIYPIKMIDNPKIPAITYQRLSSIRNQTISSPGRVFYCDAIFQIDIWDVTYENCRAMAALIFSILEGYRGVVLGIDIQAILSQNEQDLYDDDVKIYRRSQTFRITFIENY